jgi:hypothetical protein
MIRNPGSASHRRISLVGLFWVVLCTPAIVLGAAAAGLLAAALAPLTWWGGPRWRRPATDRPRHALSFTSFDGLVTRSGDLRPR